MKTLSEQDHAMSVPQIAARLGMSRVSVERTIRRALLKMRRYFERHPARAAQVKALAYHGRSRCFEPRITSLTEKEIISRLLEMEYAGDFIERERQARFWRNPRK